MILFTKVGPLGSSTSGELQLVRRLATRQSLPAPEELDEPFWGYLLDGQQRLTSLSFALRGQTRRQPGYPRFFDVRKARFVMGKRTRTIEKRIAKDDPTLVELSRLIPKGSITPVERETILADILGKLTDKRIINKSHQDQAKYRAQLTTVANMLEATSPCEDFETEDTDEDLDNAIELFKRLNKGGKPLSRGDAEAATLTHRATADIVPKMRELCAKRAAALPRA